MNLTPLIRRYYVEVQEMDMYRPSSDLKRLKLALNEQWQLS
ncbi:MAG: hypothetical protein R2880_10605 [Deinococcales bacterium]